MKKYIISGKEKEVIQKKLRNVKSFSIGYVTCNDTAQVQKQKSGSLFLYVTKVRNVCYNMQVTLELYKFGSQKDLKKFLKTKAKFVSFE